MKYYKKYCIRGKWLFMTLSDSEVKEIEEQLRNDNLKIMAECIHDASQLRSNVATALFERRADAKFTRIQSKLDEKIKQAEEGTIINISMRKDKGLKEEKIDTDSTPVMDYTTGLVIKDKE